MKRSELANSAGCHSETARFYETKGLLPAPPRNAAGHRVYGREHARRLRFIVRARELGFSLDQIGQLLRLRQGGGSVCAEARALTLTHLDDIGRKITDLARLEQALRSMVARCDETGARRCPIIDTLFERPPAP